MSAPARSRPPRPTLQPRFTLGIIYILLFFFIYCFLLVTPSLIEVLRTVPPGPEQEEIAREVAREAIQPRLWIALALAVATTAIGVSRGLLPGTRYRG